MIWLLLIPGYFVVAIPPAILIGKIISIGSKSPGPSEGDTSKKET